MLCNPPSLRAGICCDLPPAPACVRWEQGPYPDHSGHCITQFNGWMFVQHSVSHITGCTADHTVQLPQMIVERCIVVENHSGACIQMRLTNASSSCAGHNTPPLWKSQGSLKAALRHTSVNASYCDLKVCDTSASAPITALTLHLATCKNDSSFVMRS